ncbi:MAG: GxxExxY protein [Bdellovibrio bacteriovorus]
MNANGEGAVASGAPISRRVIGCAFTVSNALGAGFVESVYESALCRELVEQGIAFERQPSLRVFYKGEVVGSFIADLIIERQLLVELKALRQLTSEHESQVMNYLKASGLGVGLLLNFGSPKLEIRRIVWGHDDGHSV